MEMGAHIRKGKVYWKSVALESNQTGCLYCEDHNAKSKLCRLSQCSYF